jgi:hypothetical protein
MPQKSSGQSNEAAEGPAKLQEIEGQGHRLTI